MEYIIDVPEYLQSEGISLKWEVNFKISTRVDDKEIIAISANPQGLISLARHLLVLAQASVPIGCHIHLDVSNSLEDGSRELVIERA
jgi:hypothetical protein